MQGEFRFRITVRPGHTVLTIHIGVWPSGESIAVHWSLHRRPFWCISGLAGPQPQALWQARGLPRPQKFCPAPPQTGHRHFKSAESIHVAPPLKTSIFFRCPPFKSPGASLSKRVPYTFCRPFFPLVFFQPVSPLWAPSASPRFHNQLETFAQPAVTAQHNGGQTYSVCLQGFSVWLQLISP